ncbi:hypothetical protein SCHPADRAFT_942574 [Schizopora paradoxa]|uniref:MYND-type domain-containing protein n=1 Tax=Schizopora paradoxa TaxID=27342 RepID=A0A0H2RG20_9AGAM|nr:hypothetical protein SCHPADRAFT_942574 [Schizopora paradoxa]
MSSLQERLENARNSPGVKIGRPAYFDEQRTEYFVGLLKTDYKTVIKSVEAGEFSALRAIAKYQLQPETCELKLPDDFYLELFPVCCVHASNVKCGGDSKAMARAFQSGLTLPLAVYSLVAIGSQGMQKAGINRKEDFEPLILTHWSDLFIAMSFVYEMHANADEEAGFPMRNQWISAALCNAMLTLLSCEVFTSNIPRSSIFFENVWKWWLYGGPPDYESKERLVALSNNITSICLSVLYHTLDTKDVPLSIVLKSSSAYGGIAAVADLALNAFHASAMAKDIEAVKCQFLVFLLFYAHKDAKGEEHDLCESFVDGIYESGGMSKLIKALVHLLTFARDEILNPEQEVLMVTFIGILQSIMDRSHRHIEEAARSGILEFFIALDPERGDVPRLPMLLAKKMLEMLPLYFVYHSVIGSYAAEMRKLTEGDRPKDSCLAKSDGPFATSWRKLKQLLIERYCVKRFYDFVIAPAPRLKYCNSCGKSESTVPFLMCAKCRRVLYCSKKCQVTDWKEDGHRKDCQEGLHLYGTDIPFLCFLTNMYLTARYFAILETYKQKTDPDISLKNAVFRVWFSFGNSLRPVLSITHVRDAGSQLAKRIEPTTESESESGEKCDTVARGGLHTSPPPIYDAKTKPGGGTKPGPGAQIAVDVYDQANTVVVRHIAFQPDFRTLMNIKNLDHDSPYAQSDEEPRVAAIGINPDIGKADAIWVHDVVDVIFEQFYAPGEDSWTFHLREDPVKTHEGGNQSKRKHILDFVDDYIKDNLMTVEESLNEMDAERMYDIMHSMVLEADAMRGKRKARSEASTDTNTTGKVSFEDVRTDDEVNASKVECEKASVSTLDSDDELDYL